jgi:hypothetical protein
VAHPQGIRNKPVYYPPLQMLAKTSTLVCVVLGAALSTARADDAPPAAAAADGTYQLTLPKGRLLLDAFAEINLSDGAVFKPFSLSPDLWYGATDELTVGIVHSALGRSGFIGGVGDSLCLTGTTGNCSSVYPTVGLDVRFKLKPTKFAWAIDGGVYAINTDPLAFAIKAGVIGRWQKDKLAIEAAPNLFFGLNERSVLNKETLNLPGTVIYTVAPKVSIAGQIGFVLPIEDLGDFYTISLAIGAHYDVNDSLTVNAAFALPRLIAGVAGGVDARTFTLGGTYAF